MGGHKDVMMLLPGGTHKFDKVNKSKTPCHVCGKVLGTGREGMFCHVCKVRAARAFALYPRAPRACPFPGVGTA